ncbi:MAG TPA: STAS domain-containing protein [Polyangiaceae bacterium]
MASMQQPEAFYGHLDQSLILVLKGQVRYMTARVLRSFVDELLANESSDTMVLDLRELEFIDSTGMGLLARLGRFTLEHGRRAVIVCGVPDVVTCLRSAAFDTIFILADEWPFDEEASLFEVPLEGREVIPDIMCQVMLDAHRDLSSLSADNEQIFAGVITALESELARKKTGPTYQ